MALASSNSTPPSLLLRALSAEARARLLASATRRRFPKGATIFMIGDPGDGMYLIDEGRVEISLTSLNGRRMVLNHMGPGEVLGEIAMLDGGPRSADATAATDAALLSLSRTTVLSFLQAHPDSAIALIGELCAKVRNASDMFDVQAQTEAKVRLARCLLRFGNKWGRPAANGAVRLPTGFNQMDLGEFAGLARENVNRHLRSWATEGVVDLDHGEIVLRDLEALRTISEA